MALVLSRRFMRSNKSQPSLPSLPPLLARFQFLCMEARKRLLVILDSEDDIKIDRAGLRRGRGGRAGLGTVALSESVVPDSTCSRTSRRMTSQRRPSCRSPSSRTLSRPTAYWQTVWCQSDSLPPDSQASPCCGLQHWEDIGTRYYLFDL